MIYMFKKIIKKLFKKKIIIISLTLFDIIDYLYKYKTYNNEWGNNNIWNEYRPILNNLIIEPSNTISSLSFSILINIYKNTKFDLMQQISSLMLTNGTFMFHSSGIEYYSLYDWLGMTSYLLNIVLKDCDIFNLINNDKVYTIYIPLIFLLSRLLLLYNNKVYKGYYLYNLFEILISLKITGEIKKTSIDNLQMNIYFILWFIISSYYNTQFVSRKYSKYNHLYQIIYYLIIYNKKINKNLLDKNKILLSFLFILVAFIFQEDKFFNFNSNSSDSIIQYHAIWHILASIGFYFEGIYNLQYI